MAWMRMPEQTWPGLAATFVGMWTVMMAAMMLPVLAPMLWRYRIVAGRTDGGSLGRLMMVAGAAYLAVWTVIGVLIFPLGVAFAALQMRVAAPRIAMATGAALVIAGLIQFTAWKLRLLACCRMAPQPSQVLPANTFTAWRHGLRLGIQCSGCCANLTAVLLIIGVMDLRAMVIVAAAIALERLTPGAWRAARMLGVALIGLGLLVALRVVEIG